MPSPSTSICCSALLLLVLLPCGGCRAICDVLGIPQQYCAPQNQNDLQTRPLQDLLVTHEVRFLGVHDDFFDRIGIDFDFDINSEAVLQPSEPTAAMVPTNPVGNAYLSRSTQVGGQKGFDILVPRLINNFNYFLPLLPQNSGTQATHFSGLPLIRNLPVQNIFQRSDLNNIPGGNFFTSRYTPDAVSMGFAILSDIEAALFLEAAQKDARNSILAAPQLHLFNEQPGVSVGRSEFTTINDVQPAFANAAKAVDPLIGIMTSGPTLQITPVISADRRQVRLDVRPLITGIAEFPAGQSNGVNQFVQFPIVEPAAVQASVTVNDGGTVLFGRQKQTAAGSFGRGVPFLNKLPYVNRLFKNNAVIKDDQHVLIMVTPRIVIREEDENLPADGD